MKRLKQVLTANGVAFALLCTGAATAQPNQTQDNFSDDLEFWQLGSLDGQRSGPNFWEVWHVQGPEILVTNAQANSGAQSLDYSAGNSVAIHIGFLDNNPNDGPVIWEDSFSVFMPSTATDAFLRSEPFSNFPANQGGGFGPQVAVFQNDPDSFRITVGGVDIGAGNFATNQWWNVSFIADGDAKVITDFSIEGSRNFNAAGLSLPWNLGDRLLVRPERVSIRGRDVFVDDVGSRIVPEPGTIWLLLIGGVAVMRTRRR